MVGYSKVWLGALLPSGSDCPVRSLSTETPSLHSNIQTLHLHICPTELHCAENHRSKFLYGDTLWKQVCQATKLKAFLKLLHTNSIRKSEIYQRMKYRSSTLTNGQVGSWASKRVKASHIRGSLTAASRLVPLMIGVSKCIFGPNCSAVELQWLVVHVVEN